MYNFIKRLQKKPEQDRRAIALGVSGLVTFLIAIVWISNLTLGGEAAPTQTAAAGVPSPFATLKEGLNTVVDGFNNGPGIRGATAPQAQ